MAAARVDRRITALLHSRVRQLAIRWAPLGYPPPSADVLRVTLNRRFTARLASADPARQIVSLRGDAPSWPAKLLQDILTHELAHLAVHARHGEGPAPHGGEWRLLMEAAGVLPAARQVTGCRMTRQNTARALDGRNLTTVRPRLHGAQRGSRRYEHRCAVCQMTRVARRPVPEWRCQACVDAGLDGHLLIARVPTP
jgi:hypothetical protein